MSMITIDHSDKYPYAYYDDQEGITSANNPEFWYAMCMSAPRYPVPAIPLLIGGLDHDGYPGMLYVDDMRFGEDDPQMIAVWDFWDQNSPEYGKYQRC